MKQIFIGIGAEFQKIKHTFTYYFTIISAVLIPALIFVVQLIQPERYIPSANTNPWDTLFTSNISLIATFFVPFYIVLAVALNLNIEHKENAWKKILLLPVSRTSIYVSKITFILLQVVAFLALFLGSIIISGYILGAVHSELAYFQNIPNISNYSFVLFHLFIALLGMFSIQFILSLFFKNIIIPISAGVFATVVAVIISAWEYAIFYPYAFSALILQSQETYSFNVIELVSMGIFVTLLLAGALVFNKKTIN